VTFLSLPWLKSLSARTPQGKRPAGGGDMFDDVTVHATPPLTMERNQSTLWAQSAVRNSVEEAAEALTTRQSPPLSGDGAISVT